MEQLAGVARFMEGFQRPWFIVGGWAVDLFLGRVSREHEDTDVGVFREDQLVLQSHLAGWQLWKVSRPGELEPWLPGEWLGLPVHEIHAERDGGEPREDEFLLNERDGDNWLYRRDPSIGRPLSRAVLHSQSGIPFLAPEIALLYKSKHAFAEGHHGRKYLQADILDLDNLLPAMDAEQRAWLTEALQKSYPTHPWLAPLVTA